MSSQSFSAFVVQNFLSLFSVVIILRAQRGKKTFEDKILLLEKMEWNELSFR